ncbi:MAG: RNA methyltransferase [Candidatus Dojkabacteria bacterium]
MHKPLSKKEIKKLNEKALKDIKNNYDIVVLLQDVVDPINVGSIFRTADAFGIKKVVLTNMSPKPPDPAISMTARGLEKKIKWEYFSKAEDAISSLREDGYQIVAVELTEDSVFYGSADFSEKVCLVLGNEASGVYKKILKLCDIAVHIPMLGKGPSLNVNVAGAIVLGEIMRRSA